MITRSEKNEKIRQELIDEEKKKKRKKIIIRILIILITIIAIIGLILGYMRFIGTKGLEVREYKVVNNKLPDSFHGFKVVQFSDLHYLSTVNKSDLKNIINKINKLKPDIVVFTGDLIDKDANVTDNDISDVVELFNKIKVTTGMYAVKGNHDYSNNYFDIIFNQTNFKVLNNTYDLIYYHSTSPILITGVGSAIKGDMDLGSSFSYNEADNIYTIFLLHEPDNIDKAISTNSVDLALAGHSHNGQIRLPKIGSLVKNKGARKYDQDYYRIGKTDLYISGGIGTSSFKLRFFTRPSINIYRLVEK